MAMVFPHQYRLMENSAPEFELSSTTSTTKQHRSEGVHSIAWKSSRFELRWCYRCRKEAEEEEATAGSGRWGRRQTPGDGEVLLPMLLFFDDVRVTGAAVTCISIRFPPNRSLSCSSEFRVASLNREMESRTFLNVTVDVRDFDLFIGGGLVAMMSLGCLMLAAGHGAADIVQAPFTLTLISGACFPRRLLGGLDDWRLPDALAEVLLGMFDSLISFS